jgi:hypothetical protein
MAKGGKVGPAAKQKPKIAVEASAENDPVSPKAALRNPVATCVAIFCDAYAAFPDVNVYDLCYDIGQLFSLVGLPEVAQQLQDTANRIIPSEVSLERATELAKEICAMQIGKPLQILHPRGYPIFTFEREASERLALTVTNAGPGSERHPYEIRCVADSPPQKRRLTNWRFNHIRKSAVDGLFLFALFRASPTAIYDAVLPLLVESRSLSQATDRDTATYGSARQAGAAKTIMCAAKWLISRAPDQSSDQHTMKTTVFHLRKRLLESCAGITEDNSFGGAPNNVSRPEWLASLREFSRITHNLVLGLGSTELETIYNNMVELFAAATKGDGELRDRIDRSIGVNTLASSAIWPTVAGDTEKQHRIMSRTRGLVDVWLDPGVSFPQLLQTVKALHQTGEETRWLQAACLVEQAFLRRCHEPVSHLGMDLAPTFHHLGVLYAVSASQSHSLEASGIRWAVQHAILAYLDCILRNADDALSGVLQNYGLPMAHTGDDLPFLSMEALEFRDQVLSYYSQLPEKKLFHFPSGRVQKTLHEDERFVPTIYAARELNGGNTRGENDLAEALSQLQVNDSSQYGRTQKDFDQAKDVFAVFGDRRGQWQMLLDCAVLAQGASGWGEPDPKRAGPGSLEFRLKLEPPDIDFALPVATVTAEVLTPAGAFPVMFNDPVIGEATLGAYGGSIEACAEFLSTPPHRIHYVEAEHIASALAAPTVRIPLLVQQALQTPRLLEDTQYRQLLTAALFEPGPWIKLDGSERTEPPDDVPCTREELGTPLGILAMELANPPLVDLRHFRGTRKDGGASWMRIVASSHNFGEEDVKQDDPFKKTPPGRAMRRFSDALPQGWRPEVDGEWVTPVGWHPEEDSGEEEVTDEPPNVPFTGGLLDASRPLEVVLVLVRIAARLSTFVAKEAFQEFMDAAAERITQEIKNIGTRSMQHSRLMPLHAHRSLCSSNLVDVVCSLVYVSTWMGEDHELLDLGVGLHEVFHKQFQVRNAAIQHFSAHPEELLHVVEAVLPLYIESLASGKDDLNLVFTDPNGQLRVYRDFSDFRVGRRPGVFVCTQPCHLTVDLTRFQIGNPGAMSTVPETFSTHHWYVRLFGEYHRVGMVSLQDDGSEVLSCDGIDVKRFKPGNLLLQERGGTAKFDGRTWTPVARPVVDKKLGGDARCAAAAQALVTAVADICPHATWWFGGQVDGEQLFLLRDHGRPVGGLPLRPDTIDSDAAWLELRAAPGIVRIFGLCPVAYGNCNGRRTVERHLIWVSDQRLSGRRLPPMPGLKPPILAWAAGDFKKWKPPTEVFEICRDGMAYCNVETLGAMLPEALLDSYHVWCAGLEMVTERIGDHLSTKAKRGLASNPTIYLGTAAGTTWTCSMEEDKKRVRLLDLLRGKPGKIVRLFAPFATSLAEIIAWAHGPTERSVARIEIPSLDLEFSPEEVAEDEIGGTWEMEVKDEWIALPEEIQEALTDQKSRRMASNAGRVLIQVDGTPYSVNVHSSNMVATNQKTGRDNRVRYNLYVEEDTRYYCDSLPGYYVASTDIPAKEQASNDDMQEDPRQTLLTPQLTSLPHALLLKHNCGDFKVMVPFRFPVRSPVMGEPLSAVLTFLPRLNESTPLSGMRRVFIWDAHSSGQFILPNDMVGLLYLALCHVLSRNYAAAAALLPALYIGNLDPEARLVLDRIFVDETENGWQSFVDDTHPDATAFRITLALRASHLCDQCPNLNEYVHGQLDLTCLRNDLTQYAYCASRVSEHCALSWSEELAAARLAQVWTCRTIFLASLDSTTLDEKLASLPAPLELEAADVTPACIFDEMQTAGPAVLQKWIEDGAGIASWLSVSERSFFTMADDAAADILLTHWEPVLWLHDPKSSFIILYALLTGEKKTTVGSMVSNLRLVELVLRTHIPPPGPEAVAFHILCNMLALAQRGETLSGFPRARDLVPEATKMDGWLHMTKSTAGQRWISQVHGALDFSVSLLPKWERDGKRKVGFRGNKSAKTTTQVTAGLYPAQQQLHEFWPRLGTPTCDLRMLDGSLRESLVTPYKECTHLLLDEEGKMPLVQPQNKQRTSRLGKKDARVTTEELVQRSNFPDGLFCDVARAVPDLADFALTDVADLVEAMKELNEIIGSTGKSSALLAAQNKRFNRALEPEGPKETETIRTELHWMSRGVRPSAWLALRALLVSDEGPQPGRAIAQGPDRGRYAGYSALNPVADLTTLTAMEQQTLRCLLLGVRIAQSARCAAEMDEMDEQLSARGGRCLQLDRRDTYVDPVTHIFDSRYLFFEALAGKTLSKDEFAAVSALYNAIIVEDRPVKLVKGSAIVSAMALPLLALLFQMQQHLMVFVVPQALLPNVLASQQRHSIVCGMPFVHLDFEEGGRKLLQASLARITAPNNVGRAVASPAALKTLILDFIHCGLSSAASDEFALYREVLVKLRRDGCMLVDEADIVLTPRDYTLHLGEGELTDRDVRIDTALVLVDAIYLHKEPSDLEFFAPEFRVPDDLVKALQDCVNDGIEQNQVVREPFQLLSESWYEEELMPLLARYLAQFFWEVMRLPFEHEHFLEPLDQQVSRDVNNIVRQLGAEAKSAHWVVRWWLQRFLPTLWQWGYGRDYRLNDNDRFATAPDGYCFADPDAFIGTTVLAYRARGLRPDDQKIVEYMRWEETAPGHARGFASFARPVPATNSPSWFVRHMLLHDGLVIGEHAVDISGTDLFTSLVTRTRIGFASQVPALRMLPKADVEAADMTDIIGESEIIAMDMATDAFIEQILELDLQGVFDTAGVFATSAAGEIARKILPKLPDEFESVLFFDALGPKILRRNQTSEICAHLLVVPSDAFLLITDNRLPTTIALPEVGDYAVTASSKSWREVIRVLERFEKSCAAKILVAPELHWIDNPETYAAVLADAAKQDDVEMLAREVRASCQERSFVQALMRDPLVGLNMITRAPVNRLTAPKTWGEFIKETVTRYANEFAAVDMLHTAMDNFSKSVMKDADVGLFRLTDTMIRPGVGISALRLPEFKPPERKRVLPGQEEQDDELEEGEAPDEDESIFAQRLSKMLQINQDELEGKRDPGLLTADQAEELNELRKDAKLLKKQENEDGDDSDESIGENQDPYPMSAFKDKEDRVHAFFRLGLLPLVREAAVKLPKQILVSHHVPRSKGMMLAPGIATVQWQEGKQDLIAVVTLQEAETLRRAVQVSARKLKIEVSCTAGLLTRALDTQKEKDRRKESRKEKKGRDGDEPKTPRSERSEDKSSAAETPREGDDGTKTPKGEREPITSGPPLPLQVWTGVTPDLRRESVSSGKKPSRYIRTLLIRASAPPPEAVHEIDSEDPPALGEYVWVLIRFLSGDATFTPEQERLLLHVMQHKPLALWRDAAEDERDAPRTEKKKKKGKEDDTDKREKRLQKEMDKRSYWFMDVLDKRRGAGWPAHCDFLNHMALSQGILNHVRARGLKMRNLWHLFSEMTPQGASLTLSSAAKGLTYLSWGLTGMAEEFMRLFPLPEQGEKLDFEIFASIFKAKKTKELRMVGSKKMSLADRVFLDFRTRIETTDDSLAAAVLAVESLSGRHELLRAMQAEWPCAPIVATSEIQENLADVWRAIRTPVSLKTETAPSKWGAGCAVWIRALTLEWPAVQKKFESLCLSEDDDHTLAKAITGVFQRAPGSCNTVLIAKALELDLNLLQQLHATQRAASMAARQEDIAPWRRPKRPFGTWQIHTGTGWLDLPRFNLPRTQAKAKKYPLEVLGVPCTLDIPMRQANCGGSHALALRPSPGIGVWLEKLLKPERVPGAMKRTGPRKETGLALEPKVSNLLSQAAEELVLRVRIENQLFDVDLCRRCVRNPRTREEHPLQLRESADSDGKTEWCWWKAGSKGAPDPDPRKWFALPPDVEQIVHHAFQLPPVEFERRLEKGPNAPLIKQRARIIDLCVMDQDDMYSELMLPY